MDTVRFVVAENVTIIFGVIALLVTLAELMYTREGLKKGYREGGKIVRKLKQKLAPDMKMIRFVTLWMALNIGLLAACVSLVQKGPRFIWIGCLLVFLATIYFRGRAALNNRKLVKRRR